jgi:arylsulfatase A-like enzyme
LLIAWILVLSGCGRKPFGNIILIIVDTVRADHLGCYGYHRDTTPCIDSLASRGVRYTRVTAGEPWTLPSMATIFTGLLPLEHNARRRGDSYFGIDPEAVTLTESLGGAGYRTAAFFNVVFMNQDFGFHQGFHHFDCAASLGSGSDRNAARTVDAALEWLDSRGASGDGLFLAVHFYDPHLTYSPPDSFADLWRNPRYSGPFDGNWGRREAVVNVNRGVTRISDKDLFNLEALYDGELAYTDSQIGRLLSGLRQRGLTGNALVILVADHGEEFQDHGKLGHAHTLFEELLHVPLVISGPGFGEGVVDGSNLSQADIMPTVLEWAGVPAPEGLFGVSLLSGGPPADRAVPSGMSLSQRYAVIARRGDLKVHLVNGGESEFMFDLAGDPGEHSAVTPVDSSLAEAARFYLATPPLYDPAPVMVENAFLDALRNLGYI